LAGPLTVNGNTVTGGPVLDVRAVAGSAFGSGIFLQGNGGPLTFTPGGAEAQSVANDIADQTGSGGTGTNAGSWGLTKSGAGTLTLAGANTYSGATLVSAGTLLVDGSITSPVTVTNGGTLGGAGTVSNTVTVNAGGTLSPGSSPAILSTGSVSLTAGSTLTAELNGATVGAQYDQLRVNGGVSLGNATLNVVPGFTPSPGQTFTIIANDLADAVVGTFSGLPEGSIFTAGSGRFGVSYLGGTGNDVTLAAVAAATFSKAFAPPGILVGGTTTLTFTLTNPNPTLALNGVGFTDTLPSGLVVATPNGLSSTCGGSVTAIAGSGSVVLTAGGLAPGGSCTISVGVLGSTGGLKGNITSALTSVEGGTGGGRRGVPGRRRAARGGAADDRQGVRHREHPRQRHDAADLHVDQSQSGPGPALTGVGFTDTLPAGLTVANGSGATCGGTLTTSGGNAIALAGAAIARGAACSFSVAVTATTPGEGQCHRHCHLDRGRHRWHRLRHPHRLGAAAERDDPNAFPVRARRPRDRADGQRPTTQARMSLAEATRR
jgi:uncharacterized repeat protein (TIGR01451 family)